MSSIQPLIRPKPLTHRCVEALFNRLFGCDYHCQLQGGADEPVYLASPAPGQAHRVLYRHDYIASALHEVAHWCVAGPQRRLKNDYGYWYTPDTRDAAAQRRFEQVEILPQAIECLFSRAAGLRFLPSADNLSRPDDDDFGFSLAVWQRAQALKKQGLTGRAGAFAQGLADLSGRSLPLPTLAEMSGFDG